MCDVLVRLTRDCRLQRQRLHALLRLPRSSCAVPLLCLLFRPVCFAFKRSRSFALCLCARSVMLVLTLVAAVLVLLVLVVLMLLLLVVIALLLLLLLLSLIVCRSLFHFACLGAHSRAEQYSWCCQCWRHCACSGSSAGQPYPRERVLASAHVVVLRCIFTPRFSCSLHLSHHTLFFHRSSLHEAAKCGTLEIAQLLLSAGADVNTHGG